MGVRPAERRPKQSAAHSLQVGRVDGGHVADGSILSLSLQPWRKWRHVAFDVPAHQLPRRRRTHGPPLHTGSCSVPPRDLRALFDFFSAGQRSCDCRPGVAVASGLNVQCAVVSRPTLNLFRDVRAHASVLCRVVRPQSTRHRAGKTTQHTPPARHAAYDPRAPWTAGAAAPVFSNGQ